MATNKNDIRSFERTRAANIVSSYENELRSKLAAKPSARNAHDVSIIIDRLQNMRREIMGSMREYKAPIKRAPGGDFSQDEMEAAMEFLNSSEENPFDG